MVKVITGFPLFWTTLYIDDSYKNIVSLIYMKAAVVLVYLYLLLRNSFRKPRKGVQNER